MFSANKKVSIRQLNRIIVTENIGMVCLFAGYMAAVLKSLSYVWVMVAAMGISVAYLWIMLLVSKGFGEKLLKNKIFNIITGIRFFIMGVIGIYILYKIVAEILLQNTYGPVIVVTIGIFCVFMAKCDYEARGRIHEILGILVIIPIVIILITASFKINISYGIDQLHSGFKIPDRQGILGILGMLLSTTYFEKLIIIQPHFYNTRGNRVELIKAPIILWSSAIWVFVVCVCIFRENGSLLKLMDIGGIPGGFFNRQESIMAAFLIISLTSYVSGMMYYIGKRRKKIAARLIVLLMIAGGFCLQLRFGDDDRIWEGNIIGNREIEEWDFVMSMIINGEGYITFEIGGDEDEGNDYIVYPTNSIERASELHIENGRKNLEFSHIKAILLENVEEVNPIIDELVEDKRFSGNVLVFTMNEQLEQNLWEMELGSTLEKLGENIREYKNSCLYQAGISEDNIIQIKSLKK